MDSTASSTEPSSMAGSNQRAYVIWALALIASTGSLFFSEVMKLPPCVLCWYQRIAMYPLVLIIPVAIVSGEYPRLSKYVNTLAWTGLVIAVYHNLLYYHIIPDSITPCTSGVSCTSRQLEWLGFITIPLLSMTAFSAILISNHFLKPKDKQP